jgi:signal transduction histidine kinase
VFGNQRAWARRHPTLMNVLWIAPLAVLAFAAPPVDIQGRLLPLWAHLGLATLLLAPLLWRRTRPRETFAAVALISFAQWLADIPAITANLAMIVAMYGVASRARLAWAVAAGLVTELGVLLALVRWHEWAEDPAGLVGPATVYVGAIWIGGIYANTRRRYLESLEERAERAERERDQQAQIAAAAERVRIARELHDVVAHNVSVMVVQADGAAYAIDSRPEQARRAVQAISTTGRQALAEMRRLVGVLRQGDPGAPDYTPQPGLAQLDDLIAQVRGSGLPIDLRVSGTPTDIPEGEQLTVYRIMQEALTNTLKHGGPGATAVVDLEYGAREIVVRVTDDGRGAAPPGEYGGGHGGHGLLGMRERVGLFGGTMTAAPRIGGGFQVCARLPIVGSAQEGARSA